jgi:hypothetical protein
MNDDAKLGETIESDGGRGLITYCDVCGGIHRTTQPHKPW